MEQGVRTSETSIGAESTVSEPLFNLVSSRRSTFKTGDSLGATSRPTLLFGSLQARLVFLQLRVGHYIHHSLASCTCLPIRSMLPLVSGCQGFWVALSDFNDVVDKAWNEHTIHTEPYQVLFHKLKMTTIHLYEWRRALSSKIKMHLHAVLLVILRFDIAQERRQLSTDEHDLRSKLKRRVISLVVLQRARKRQCARVANHNEGDENTMFFHPRVNARRHKNHIHMLRHVQGWVTKHGKKEAIIHDHFANMMGGGQHNS